MLRKIKNIFCPKPDPKKAIEDLLKQSIETRQIDPKTSALIEGALHLMDLHVNDIMLPRSQMVVIKIDQSIDEILKIVTESAHSRFPIVDAEESQVLGLLLAKDLLRLIAQTPESTSIREILRKPYFVPSSKRLKIIMKLRLIKSYTTLQEFHH